MKVFLGIDVGSVTTKLALVDESAKFIDGYMLRTAGQPTKAVQKGLAELYSRQKGEWEVTAVGTTGSGRNLAGALVGADIIKNEITAHAVAASTYVPDVQTILEIGGQDSKIIILRDGIVIFEGKMASLKRFKDDAKEVKQGYECGITIENFNDIKEYDVIEASVMKEVER